MSPENSAPGLFSESDLAAASTASTLRERLIGAYRDDLIANPPADSVNPAKRGEGEARATAERIARRQDVPRLLRAVKASDLEICRAGRLADLLEIVADFLATYDQDCARGGGGPEDESETLDFEALIERARTAISLRGAAIISSQSQEPRKDI